MARSDPSPTLRQGLSDRTIAWIFIAPVIVLLLGINIFPFLWAVGMSFTDFRANQPGRDINWVGFRNYDRLLESSDIHDRFFTTLHFAGWTILIESLLGLGLALLVNRNFRGAGFWTAVMLIPIMLSPAVVGAFWKYLYQPQTGIFSYIVNLFSDVGPLNMIGAVDLAPWSIVIVDVWMWTPYVMLLCLAGLRSIPAYLYEAASIDGANALQKFWYVTLPRVLPFLMLAVLFRGIENLKMFDMVTELTSGGPGSTTELASITLKRAAFENWKTGYASAFAVIMFLIVYAMGFAYVKLLNRVKSS